MPAHVISIRFSLYNIGKSATWSRSSMWVRLNVITVGCASGTPCEGTGVAAAGKCTVADSWPCASAGRD